MTHKCETSHLIVSTDVADLTTRCGVELFDGLLGSLNSDAQRHRLIGDGAYFALDCSMTVL